jgi:arabinose-5-phosphate isomerase
MHSGNDIPMVAMGTSVKEALFEITNKKLGITGIANADGSLAGVFTDGDLRRCLEENATCLEQSIADVMTTNPKRVLRHHLAARVLQRMEEHQITSLFVFETDDSTTPVGIVHLHDLLKAGVV